MLLNLDWCKHWVIDHPSSCLLQLSGSLTIPWWQWFLTRFGKKTAVYVGTLVSKNYAFLKMFLALIWRDYVCLWHFPFNSGRFPSCSSSSPSRATWSFRTWCPWQPAWAWRQLSSCLGGFIHPLDQMLVSCNPSLFLNAAFVFFRSMLPDVVDDFKVRNPHIHGHEALFFSFYVFFIKFASGVSLGVSTLSLK